MADRGSPLMLLAARNPSSGRPAHRFLAVLYGRLEGFMQ